RLAEMSPPPCRAVLHAADILQNWTDLPGNRETPLKEPGGHGRPEQHAGAGHTLAQLIQVYDPGNGAVLGVQKVHRSAVRQYGIVATQRVAAGLHRVLDLVEKPTAAAAPSRYAVIGRYVLSPDIFAILERTAPGKNREIQLTDALRLLARNAPIYAQEIKGQRHDAGDKLGFLKATVAFALKDPVLGPEFSRYLKQLR
ncbi:MAG: sugar phosphate nucleotidyltransferase, partial [Nitrospirota bacterium]